MRNHMGHGDNSSTLKSLSKTSGFALIELLVSALALSVLSAIAIPIYSNQRTGANAVTARTDAHQLASSYDSVLVAKEYIPPLGGIPAANLVITANGLTIKASPAFTGGPAVDIQVPMRLSPNNTIDATNTNVTGPTTYCMAVYNSASDTIGTYGTGCTAGTNNSGNNGGNANLAAPTEMTLTPGDGTITVNWVVNPDATSYVITVTGNGIGCASRTTPPCTIMALDNGTPYTVTITATDGTNTSPPVSMTTTPVPQILAYGFDKALFSQGSIATTNAFTVQQPGSNQANVYTGGDFACNTNVNIYGRIIANGSATLTNNCTTNGVWARTAVVTSTTGVKINGDVNVSNGNLTINNNPLDINGNVSVSGTIINTDGKTPDISGTTTTGATVQAPPALNLPKIAYAPASWPGTYSTTDWGTWIKSQAISNGAPTWSALRTTGGDKCAVSQANYSLNGSMNSPSSPTILDATACDLHWQDGSAPLRLTLNSDLVIYAKSFYHTGALQIVSGDASSHNLWIIVPWPTAATGTDCTNSNAGSITFNAGGTTLSSSINMMLYTPGAINLTNNMSFYGQMYSCTVNTSVNTTLYYVPMGIPH